MKEQETEDIYLEFMYDFNLCPLNLNCLHCLQHVFFEHLFNLYFIKTKPSTNYMGYVGCIDVSHIVITTFLVYVLQ